jgi:UDP-glucose 4-epimerase
MQKNMKFLITGGAGFIGSNIASSLIEDKKGEVVVLDNLSVGKKESIPQGCDFIEGDIRNKADLEKAMKGVDIIFHDAALVTIRGSFEKFQETVETNYLGTQNVLEAAAKAGVKKIIFASSMGVYGESKYLPVDEKHPLDTVSPYGLSKIMGELLCQLFEKNYNIVPVILRYFNTYGVGQTPSPYVGVITTFINQGLRGEPLTIFGDGKQTRDFVWVKDIVQANLLAAFSNARGIFNVGSGQEISINDIAEPIAKTLGVKIVHQDSPSGEIKKIVADIKKAKEELGYNPNGEIFKILPSLIDWWQGRL